MKFRLSVLMILAGMLVLLFPGEKSWSMSPDWENKITSIAVDGTGEELAVTIEGNTRPTYTAYQLIDPFRIVVDLPETDLSEVKGPIRVENGMVKQIEVQNLNEYGRRVGRVEIGLEKVMEYDARSEGNSMIVQISQADDIPPLEEISEEEVPALEEIPAEAEMPPLEEIPVGEAPPLEEFPEAVPPLEESPGAEMPPLEEAPMGEVPLLEEAPATEVPILEEAPPVAEMPPAEEVETGKATKILDFKVEKKGGITEIQVVGNGEIGDYSSFKMDYPPRLVVDIMEVGNLYPATEIPVGAPGVQVLRIGQHPDKVRLVLDPAEGGIMPHRISREQNRLIISVGQEVIPEQEGIIIAEAPAVAEVPPSEFPSEVPPYEEMPEEVVQPIAPEEDLPPLEEAPVPGMFSPPAPEVPAGEKKPAAPAAPFLQPRVPVMLESPTQGRFAGKKIDLEFRDADIRDVLRIISDVSNLNIIVGDDVSGKLTLKLINVPWDQALDLILKTHNLGMDKMGNILRVAPADKLRKEVHDRLQAERQKEELEPLVTKIVPVNYGTAGGFSSQIKGLLSERGTVDIDTRTNVLIIKDISRNIEASVKLVKSLDTQTPQVLIEARIVEASTRFSRDMGIQWGGRYQATPATGNPTGLMFPNSIGVGGGIPSMRFGEDHIMHDNPYYAVNFPAAVGTGEGGGGSIAFTFGSINNIMSLDLRLSAMEGAGEGKIISSPRIITLDNRKASIKQGLSIPYETTSQTGTQTQFIDATLKLEVTPHVTANRSVIMKIRAEKNAPDTTVRSTGGVPSISKKETDSEILVQDGETVVIGGIYTIEKTESHSRIPLLSSIPILGWLFKRDIVENNRNELLIFVTPKVVGEKEA